MRVICSLVRSGIKRIFDLNSNPFYCAKGSEIVPKIGMDFSILMINK
jgi:hypothetical protein